MDADTHAQITEILDSVLDMSLATLRSDGFPQANVVSFVHDDLTLYFMTVAGSQKALNLAHSDKVSGTVTRPYERWDEIEGLSFAGHARLVTGTDETAHIAGLMLDRFPQIREMETPDALAGMQPVYVRIDPVVFSVLDYSQVFGHTDLVPVQPLLG